MPHLRLTVPLFGVRVTGSMGMKAPGWMILVLGFSLSACSLSDVQYTSETTDQSLALADPDPATFQAAYHDYKNIGFSDIKARKCATDDYYFQTGELPDSSWLKN